MSDTMFAADSFIVRPPAVVALEHRICLEAIAFAMRSALTSLELVRHVTASHDEKNPYSEQQRILLYSNVWTIVDQIHFLRKLFGYLRFDQTPGAIADFCAHYEIATTIRNQMDHLSEKINNLAKLKSKRPTVFGSLSYFKYIGVRKNKDEQDVHFGLSVALPFGNISQSNHKFPAVNPLGKPIAVGSSLFTFSAFGETFEVYKLLNDLPILARHFEELVRSVVAQAQKDGEKQGADPAHLLNQPGNILMMIEMEFPAR